MDVQVPDDIVLLLLQYCEVPALLKFRQTCRRIHSISLAKQLWVILYFRHVVGLNLPTPTYLNEIDSLSATQLQAFVLHALRLCARTIENPDHFSPTIVPFYRTSSITWVRLILSTWLLVASSDRATSSIALWSVNDLLLCQQSPKPVTEAYLEAPVSNGVIDIIDGHVFIALELRGRVPTVEVLTIMHHDEQPTFQRLQGISNVSHIRFLRGPMIGASLHNNINIPCVLNWRHDITERLRAVPDLEGGSVAMHMEDDWIAVVRRQVIEDPIASTPAPPFPYSGSFCLEECEPMIFDFWKSYRLADVPDRWETDFEDTQWFSLFSGEVRVMSWDAWSLENASHYYGRPIPLLRKGF
ncbi:unnamed protein product [Somion occarium]|uniref:F-box domain-containing protein n=1 Tax=Somion occarium TaxID=3059160 RepID=A0ABP1CU88_9APHY